MKGPASHQHWIDRLALINAIIGGFTLYPQLLLLLTTSFNAQAFSLTSFLLIFLNSFIWVWYGVHRMSVPLIISSSLNALASGIILALLGLSIWR